jgi:hypothetical protein
MLPSTGIPAGRSSPPLPARTARWIRWEAGAGTDRRAALGRALRGRLLAGLGRLVAFVVARVGQRSRARAVVPR